MLIGLLFQLWVWTFHGTFHAGGDDGNYGGQRQPPDVTTWTKSDVTTGGPARGPSIKRDGNGNPR